MVCFYSIIIIPLLFSQVEEMDVKDAAVRFSDLYNQSGRHSPSSSYCRTRPSCRRRDHRDQRRDHRWMDDTVVSQHRYIQWIELSFKIIWKV